MDLARLEKVSANEWRIAAHGATSPNGVFRYRPNFLEWIDVAQFRLNPMQPARALYRDLGFRPVEAYYDNPLPGTLYMALELGE